MRTFILISILLFSSISMAQLRSANEFGLGLTDNANLEDADRDSDFFVKASTTNSYGMESHQLGVRLSYLGYLHQSTNDVFSWRLSDQFKLDSAPKWSFYGALVGQDYVAGEPGTTETSFDNVGWDFFAERQYAMNSKLELSYGPGANARYYTALSNRSDYTFFGYIDFEYEHSSILFLGARAELGFLISSDTDFSRNYIELSGDADYGFAETWNLTGEVGLRQSTFPGRTLSEGTIVTSKRGSRLRAGADAEYESHSYLYVYTEVLKDLRGSEWKSGLSLRLANQNSRSGYQNYSTTEVYGRIMYTF
jgi:hypothetical protein